MTDMPRLTLPRYQLAWSTRISWALTILETTATWPDGNPAGAFEDEDRTYSRQPGRAHSGPVPAPTSRRRRRTARHPSPRVRKARNWRQQ